MNTNIKLAPIALASVLFLSSCQTNEALSTDGEPFVQDAYPWAAVYNDYYIKMNENHVLTYYDLEEGTQTPACAIAGCTHDKNSPDCTAYSYEGIMHQPFMYGNNLYYFFSKDREDILYQCNLNGSNRQEVLSIAGEQIDEDTYTLPSVSEIKILGNTVFMSINTTYFARDDEVDFYTSYEQTNENQYKILCYNLESGETRDIYQSICGYNVGLSVHGIYDNKIYCYESYLSKDIEFENSDEWLEAVHDPNSEFNKSKINKSFTIDITDGTEMEQPYVEGSYYMMSKSGCYYSTQDGLYTIDGDKIAGEEIYSSFACAEGIIYTDTKNVYLYKDKQSKSIGAVDGYHVIEESKNNLILSSSDGGYVYCKKSDYYAGKREYKALEGM